MPPAFFLLLLVHFRPLLSARPSFRSLPTHAARDREPHSFSLSLSRTLSAATSSSKRERKKEPTKQMRDSVNERARKKFLEDDEERQKETMVKDSFFALFRRRLVILGLFFPPFFVSFLSLPLARGPPQGREDGMGCRGRRGNETR